MDKHKLLIKTKQGKKYASLTDKIVLEEIENFIKKNTNYLSFKEKSIIKQIRAILHKKYSGFNIAAKQNKRASYLEELKNNSKNLIAIKKILETNHSTKERLNFYNELYKKLFDKPKRIVDLGCGLNPISAVFMPKPLVYYCYDINEQDAIFINDFFKIEKIIGKARVLDLSDIKNYEEIPSSDICLMFKFIDSIEQERNNHRLSEEIIKMMIKKTSLIVASFATKTLGGKRMNYAGRGWFERMLTRIGLEFERLEFENEVFYLIKEK